MYHHVFIPNLFKSGNFQNINWKHTHICTQTQDFELEKPSWGRKLQNVIKNGCTVKRIHKNSLGSIYEMQLQSWACLECLQSKCKDFPSSKNLSHSVSYISLAV